MNAWLLLAIAIGLEVMATSLLKLSDGFARWHWAALSLTLYGVCFALLAPVMKALPVGVVYAIWSGVGIVGVTIIGRFVFAEQLGLHQIAFIALILAGAIGLQLTTGSHS